MDLRVSALRSKFENCNLTNAEFSANFDEMTFARCNIEATRFNLSRLLDVQFVDSDLVDTDFTDCIFSQDVLFKNCVFESPVISRSSILHMGNSQGGLTFADLQNFKIDDDQLKLRLRFHGIAKILHWLSLFVFFAPYTWFIFEQSIQAKFYAKDLWHDTMPLYEAVARYTVTGGKQWQSSWNFSLSFFFFVGFLVYNGSRFILLWKVMQLEAMEKISGIPPLFSLKSKKLPFQLIPSNWKLYSRIRVLVLWINFLLEQWFKLTWWGRIYYFTIGFSSIAYIMAILNAWHFLSMRIPLRSVAT